MLKINKFPHVVRYHSKHFKTIFNNIPQYIHFKEYLTGLMVCENKTLSDIQTKFLNSTTVNSLDHFMLHADWSEEELNRKRIEDLQRRPETASKTKGVINIDDTYTHKTGKHIEDAEIHYDHARKKMILGHNIVSSHYMDNTSDYPLDYRLYHRKPTEEALQKSYAKLEKQIDLFDQKRFYIEKLKILLDYRRRLLRFKTKISMAIELVHHAEQMKIKATTYLFDSWFLCKDLIKVIRAYGKDWISTIKHNRLLVIMNKKMSVTDFIKTIPKQSYRQIKTRQGKIYWVFSKSVKASSLGKVRIVISYDNPKLKDDPLVLVTNRKDWEAIKIVSTYAQRWGIESFYRDAKQHLGLEDYQLRQIKGIKRHWYFVFLAYSFLMLNALNSKLIKRCKTNILTIGQSSRALADEITKSLIFWIYKNFQNQRNADDIIECLLN